MNRQGAKTRVLLTVGLAMVLVAAAILPASAEEVKGKWRFEFHIGGTDPGDSISSDAGRVQVVDALRPDGWTEVMYFSDPRPGWLGGNEARISTDTYFEFRASYGIAAWKNTELVVDMGVGYSTGSIDNIELAYAFDYEDLSMATSSGKQVFSCETVAAWGMTPMPNVNCKEFRASSYVGDKWRGELVPGGELTMYPVSLGLYARFRPTKTFNPYIGLNVGYLIVEFDPSDRWRTVQDQLDRSLVDTVVRREGYAITARDLAGQAHDLKRPRIDTPSTVYFELRGGTEWQFNPKAALFVEMRYSWADKNVDITADGKHRLGQPLKQGRYDADDPAAGPPTGRPAYIVTGGLEREVTRGNIPWSGPHPGEYFFHGGELDYGGWTFTAGIRFSM